MIIRPWTNNTVVIDFFIGIFYLHRINPKAGWNKFCVSCFERLRKNRVGRNFFFISKNKIRLKMGMCQFMYFQPGKPSAVKMCLKYIFGVK